MMSRVVFRAALGLTAVLILPRLAAGQDPPASSEFAQPVARPTISVLAFDTNRTGWAPPPHFGETVADLLTDRLVESGAFRVFDRSLLPWSDQPGRRLPFDEIRQMARQSGVDYVVLGAVTTFSNERSYRRGGILGVPFLGGGGRNKQESSLGLTLRVIDVRTGEIVTTTTARGVGTKENRTLVGGAIVKGLPVGAGFSVGGSGALDRLVSDALLEAVDEAAAALAGAMARRPVVQAR